MWEGGLFKLTMTFPDGKSLLQHNDDSGKA